MLEAGTAQKVAKEPTPHRDEDADLSAAQTKADPPVPVEAKAGNNSNRRTKVGPMANEDVYGPM